MVQDFGVVLFFILSGFLITSSALSKNQYTFGRFLIDRGARMFVPYVPLLVLVWLFGALLHLPGPIDAGTFLANLFMLQDFPLHRYLPVPEFERLGSGRPLWSVAMEWWFYMAFAGLFFIRKLPIWSWPLVLSGLFVASFNATVGMLTYTWGIGAIASLLFHRLPKAPWLAIAALLAFLAIYRWKIVSGEFYDTALSVLIALALFAFIKAAEHWQPPKWLLLLASGLAAFSYTLYLVHYTVMSAMADLAGVTRIAGVFLLANALSIALYFLFERHYRKIGATLTELVLNSRTQRQAPP